jgi:hypothetical protein
MVVIDQLGIIDDMLSFKILIENIWSRTIVRHHALFWWEEAWKPRCVILCSLKSMLCLCSHRSSWQDVHALRGSYLTLSIFCNTSESYFSIWWNWLFEIEWTNKITSALMWWWTHSLFSWNTSKIARHISINRFLTTVSPIIWTFEYDINRTLAPSIKHYQAYYNLNGRIHLSEINVYILCCSSTRVRYRHNTIVNFICNGLWFLYNYYKPIRTNVCSGSKSSWELIFMSRNRNMRAIKCVYN